MAGKFTISETLNTLKAILEKHKNDRVCVLGTMCVGKTTLMNQIPNSIDMDDVAFLNTTAEEAAIISQEPWTEEIGNLVDDIVRRNVKIQPDYPMFGTVIVDCDVVVYLDIEDELLIKHCEKRGDNFKDAKNMKNSIENDWNNHKAKNDKMFYYVMIKE